VVLEAFLCRFIFVVCLKLFSKIDLGRIYFLLLEDFFENIKDLFQIYFLLLEDCY
jgi:hypothetical protein